MRSAGRDFLAWLPGPLLPAVRPPGRGGVHGARAGNRPGGGRAFRGLRSRLGGHRLNLRGLVLCGLSLCGLGLCGLSLCGLSLCGLGLGGLGLGGLGLRGLGLGRAGAGVGRAGAGAGVGRAGAGAGVGRACGTRSDCGERSGRSGWERSACGCAGRSARASLFLRCGPITMVMFRPSCLGWASTKPSSSTSPARRCSSRKPSSGRDCSRPLNMIVTLTLSPALRKRSTWPRLVP